MIIELVVIHNTGYVINNYQVKVYDRVVFYCFFFIYMNKRKVDLTAAVMY